MAGGVIPGRSARFGVTQAAIPALMWADERSLTLARGLAWRWGGVEVRSAAAAVGTPGPGGSAGRSLHETLIEMLPDAVLALDLERGRFVLANAAAERLLDTPRGQIFRLGLRDLVRPWDVSQLGRVESALSTEGQWRGELWLKRQDGTFVPSEITAQTWSLDGRTLAQLCCRDVSARWRDDAMRRVVEEAAGRLAATLDDRDALRIIATAALPGLAEAALVEIDPVDDSEPVAMVALADPASPSWPAVTVDEAPSLPTRASVRRGSLLSVPLLAHGRKIGTLTLRRPRHRTWEPSEQPLIEELAKHAAHAVDQARQARLAREELDDRAAMVRLLSTIDSDLTPRDIYKLLLDEAQAVLRADDGGAAHFEPERQLMHPAFPMSMDSCKVVDRRLMVAVAAAERCPLIENDYQRVMGRNTPAGRVGAQAVLAVPVLHGELLMGSVSISHLSPGRRFQPRDARRLGALASAAGTALAGMERQQQAGARTVVREVAHLLNNDLQLTMGSLELMQQAEGVTPEVGSLVDTALHGVTRAASHIAQLQRMTRAGGGPAQSA
jgi:GAF domain-containing protein